jgi:urea transport system substrate-binding protein
MAPEQARGVTLDHRCDLFSLGCVLFRALTGKLPFDGPDIFCLLTSLAVEEPRPIHEFAPDTPREMVELIEELLSKTPDLRPANARTVAERLRPLEGLRTMSFPSPVPVSDFITEVGARKKKDSSNRFGTGLLVGGILASMVLVLGGWSWIKVSSRTAETNIDCSLQAHPISVGVLQSPAGPLASTSASIVEATKLAIDEINEEGGVLGSRVEPIFVDSPSDESAFAEPVNRLILENHVCALFGCCSSVARKQVLPIVEKHNNLLFYPVPCEGLEESPNIVYVGAAPNQQLLPGLQFTTGTLRKRRLFLVGSDDIYSRTAHAILTDALAEPRDTRLVGAMYLPLGTSEVKEAVAKIVETKADLIVNTISGDTNVAFFRALRAAGITPEKTPTLSFHLGENELRALPVDHLKGDYAACSYFPSENRPENTAFVGKFQKRFGSHRLVTDAMESAYVAVRIWARAATQAKDSQPAAVRRAVRGLQMNGPGGPVRIDPDNQYAWRVVRVAQIGERGQFKIVWSSEEPVPPQPFPLTRKREQWLHFLAGLQQEEGGRLGALRQ